MKFRYVILSFLVMGWGYYALSGGADFVPESRIAAVPDAPSDSQPDVLQAQQSAAMAGGPGQDDFAPQSVTRADTSLVTQINVPATTSAVGTSLVATSDDPGDTLAGAQANAVADVVAGVVADVAAEDAPVFTSLSGTGTPSNADATVADRPATGPTNIQTGEDTLAQAVVSPRSDIDLRRVAGSAVNMRDGPGMGYVVIETLPADTEAEVIETENGWVYVRLMNGTTGWVAARLLTDSGI